jgi:TP901 family phage tail tape measure protein
MADLNANINVGIETTQALNQLKALQRQISQFHQSVAKSSGEAAVAQRDLQRNFLNSVNSIQGFSAELKTVRSTAESFTNSLEKNKFSMREYFRYAAGATKTFGKSFAAEFSTIEKTAIERVKTLQTQYIKMGRDASGAMQAIAIRPTVLDMKDLGTQTAIAAQKQVIFNQLLKQGSTNLLNFGKNTQWAGRQLMVGFTLPLATLGMTAGRVFFDMEKAAIKFKKVYGDLFTAPEETKQAMESIVALGQAYSAYGVAVSDSLNVAADAAAAGFAGVDLQNQTAAALKLSVLGQLELQKALETTISLQNAFQLSSADLAGEIDFLNAVENQTVVSLDDITEAVPRVAPVIKQLGGNVRDLAFFLAAMKEGGVNAAQGANALKSGLASLINPSEKSAAILSTLGINIKAIVEGNQGDIAGTVTAFAKSLDGLDPLRRAQAIEQLFGKFQFARISALFDNITREGTQAQRVLELAGSTAAELATLSESELGVSAASSMNKFRKSIEDIKVALVPIGELFVKIATPFVEFGTEMLKAFNKLPEGVKTVIGSVITILGGIGPVALMTFGLINNGIANMIKFFATVRLGYLKITGQAKGVGDETQYMTQEQLEAAAAAASLDQAHAGLTQRFTAEKTAVDQLTIAYQRAAEAGAKFTLNNPQMIKPGFGGTQAQGFAGGGVISGPGTGTSDSIPALLSNGEAVIPAKQVKRYAPLIEGMIAGNLPGFANGVMLGMPKSGKATAKNREAADAIYQEFLKSSYAGVAPTEYGHQIAPTSGHSFPIFGLGGVYQKGDKRVFVKPVMDETAALAEIRGTQITRQAHGLEAPDQRIVVIRDPMDPTRERRFLALESDLDAKFIQNEPKALFNEEQYFRQLVASLVRVDKDLAAGNVFGNVVADVGPAGVFNRASGPRALTTDLPSMEEQALINLLGIKGGAKRAFAESTLSLMAGLTPQQYHQRMLGEIQRVLPALKQTVADFKLSNPAEADAYAAMIKRLETGLGVDWSKFHSVHSGVKIAVPKKPKAVPGYADGVVSVPGQKGQGDTVPAMLSPGEAVIPAKFAKKYAPLINAMVAGNIPGYNNGKNAKVSGPKSVTLNDNPYNVRAGSEQNVAALLNKFLELGNNVEDVSVMLDGLAKEGAINVESLKRAAEQNQNIKVPQPTEALVSGHLQGTTKVLPSGERETGSFVRTMTQSQNKSLDQGGQTVEQFSAEWFKVGNALIDTVALGGAEITDGIKKAASEIDKDIHDIAVTMAENGVITDEILEKAANQALENAKARGGDSAVAAGALEKTKSMGVVKAATVPTLLDSEALKTLRDAGKLVGVKTAEQIKDVLLQEGWIDVRKTSGGRDEFFTTEKGSALTSRGEGSRLFRETSKGSAVLGADRFAKEDDGRTYLDIKEKTATLVKDIEDQVGTGLDNASGAASPSVKIGKATKNIVDAVENTIVEAKGDIALATKEMISPVTKPTQATKNSAKGSSFGNINTKEPVPAVGNAPREVVQAMSQEATATKSFVGDIKASFAAIRTNIAREFGWVKEEFKALTGGIKTNTSAASQASLDAVQKNLEMNKAANNQLIVNGKEAGFNYVAAMQGRDGAIEAVVTKGNAAIITKATEAYNSGTRLIPGFITDGLKSSFPEFEFMGERIADKVLDGAQKVSAPLMSSVPLGPEVSPAMKTARATQQATQSFVSMSESVSKISFGLSAASGLLTVFGGELSGISSVVMGLTSAMFALSQISALLARTKMFEVVAGRAAAVKDKMLAATGATSLLSSGGGLVGMFKNIGNGIRFVIRFLGPLGIGIGALAIGVPALASIFEKQKAKIEGLGNAAFLTAEKMKLAGELLGFTPKEIDFAASFTRPEGITAEEATTASSVAKDTRFLDPVSGFGKEIEAIRTASVEEAQLALEAIALRIIAGGGDAEAVAVLTGAIVEAANRKELSLDIVTNIDLATPEGQAKLSSVGAGASKIISDALAAGVSDSGFNDAQQKAINQAAGTYATLFSALRSGLDNNTISAETFNKEMDILRGQLKTMDPEALRQIAPAIASNLGLDAIFFDVNNNLITAEDKILAISAAAAGISVTSEDLLAVSQARGNATAEAFDKAAAARDRWIAGVKDNPEVVEKEAIQETIDTDLDVIDDQITANDKKLEMSASLIEAGLDEADAIAAVTDETWNGIFAKAAELDQLNGNTVATDTAIAKYKELKTNTENLTSAQNAANYDKWRTGILQQSAALKGLEKNGVPTATAIRLVADANAYAAYTAAEARGEGEKWLKDWEKTQKIADGLLGGSGSAGGSNPIQDAIDGLKKQRQEILNTSKAYSALKKSGMSAVEAYKFAQDPALVSAMTAGLKIGSKQWDEIIKRIKAAETATNKWRKSTVQGQTEVYMEAYDKVSNLFSLEEEALQSAFDKATAKDNKLINSLENQIEALNDQISGFSRGLDEIAEKEDKINQTYDKKTKALEQTKKINEDIIRQQRSQLSIADALSQGDVAAAANAIQQARSENAAAALEAQGNQLDLARSAQLAGVKSEGGLTRVQIEEKIKGLKKQVSDIEFGSLKAAQDRVKAAQEELDKNTSNLRINGLTATEWKNQKDGIDLARARAEVYSDEVKKALKSVEGITKNWKDLDGKVIITTHEINTVYKTNGQLDTSNPTSAALAKLQSGSKLTKAEQKLLGINTKADGGFISGPGTATSDSIPALLSDGEYVVKASSVDKFGKSFLDSINAGVLPGFKKGGKVGDKQRAAIIADKKTVSESLFQKAQAGQQASFDEVQNIMKGSKAAQANIDRKGKIFTEMFKALVFDASSPEMAALSAIPFGLGKVAKGLKGANQAKGIIPKPKGNFLSSRIKSKAELDEDARGLMGYNMSRYLGDANSIYSNPERSAEIARFFKLGDEMIPGELQMYRALSAGEVTGRLPRNVGDIYRPGTIKSAASAADLQALGELFTDLTKATGGKQNLAPGIAQIFTRKPIPGIEDLTKFLSTKKLDPRAAKASQFMKEYVLGPNTSYRVNSFTPGTKNSPPSWVLEAFIEKFAKGGMVKPSYFGGGGMAKKYAKGGMVKPSYFVDGGFAKGTDTVPAMLTPGEFIVNRDSAKSFSPLLSAMNNGGLNFASPVYPEISRDYASANVGGGIYPSSDVPQSNTQVDNSVYNYSLSVNVEGTDASPDQIANVVMRKLQDFGSQRVRGQVVR